MAVSSPLQPGWHRVAMELLRRFAGGEPTMSLEHLRAEGREYERELASRRLDSAYLALCSPDDPRQRLYRAFRALQVGAAREAIRELRRCEVEPLVIKSVEIGARNQAPHVVGACRDIDLLVPATALWTVEKVLYGQGYLRRQFTAETGWREMDPKEGYRLQATGYELAPFVKTIRLDGLDEASIDHAKRFPQLFQVQADGVMAICKVDVHHNILFDFDIAPMFARKVASALGEGSTLSPADHLWFMIQRYYFEVAINKQTDPRFLPTIASAITDRDLDWAQLVRNALRTNAAAPCLYWLTFFRRLGAPAISEATLGELRSHMPRSAHDYGWQLSRLFGLEESFPEHLLA